MKSDDVKNQEWIAELTAECERLNNVIDAIRAEIEQLYTVDTVYEDVVAVDKADVLQIIDKYTKGE